MLEKGRQNAKRGQSLEGSLGRKKVNTFLKFSLKSVNGRVRILLASNQPTKNMKEMMEGYPNVVQMPEQGLTLEGSLGSDIFFYFSLYSVISVDFTLGY